MRYGAVYVAHNPSDGESIFKVGKTEKEVSLRMKELTSSTSNIGQYTAIAHFIVQNLDAAEKACHSRLKSYRVQKNREFFDLPIERLLPMIKETLEPYLALSNVPETLIESQNSSQKPINPSELLKNKKNSEEQKKSKEIESKEKAKEQLQNWLPYFHEKAEYVKANLSEEKSLKWDIHNSITLDEYDYKWEPYFSVILYAEITDEPIILRHSGIRFDAFGELDLSKAISGSIKSRFPLSGDKDYEFIEWDEMDDGRLAKIYVQPALKQHYNDDESIFYSPEAQVGIEHYSYSNRRQDWENRKRTKSFTDIEEAYEIFVRLLVDNLKEPQSNIRTLEDNYGNKDKKKVRDRGRVDDKVLWTDDGL